MTCFDAWNAALDACSAVPVSRTKMLKTVSSESAKVDAFKQCLKTNKDQKSCVAILKGKSIKPITSKKSIKPTLIALLVASKKYKTDMEAATTDRVKQLAAMTNIVTTLQVLPEVADLVKQLIETRASYKTARDDSGRKEAVQTISSLVDSYITALRA